MFAAVAPGDTEKDADALAAKVLKMRLWDDDAGGQVWRDSTCTYLHTKSDNLAVETQRSRH